MLGRRSFTIGLLVLGILSGSSAWAQTSRFVYVADGEDRKILRFRILQPSHSLTPINPPVSTVTRPTSLAVDPSGTHLFVTSRDGNNVSVYSIDTNGGLTELKGSPVETGGVSPSFITVAPASAGGTYALVTNQGSNSVSVITLDKDGRPILLGQPVPTGGSGPNSVAVRANGANAYVTNGGSQSLSVFDITAGELSGLRTIALADGPQSVTVTVTPSSNEFAYVATTAGFSDASIRGYRVDDSTGELSSAGALQMENVNAFFALTPHRLGTQLYAAAEGSIAGGSINEFRINSDDGSLQLAGSASLGLYHASDLTLDDLSEHAFATSNYFDFPAQTSGYELPGLVANLGSPWGSGVRAVSVRTATGPSK